MGGFGVQVSGELRGLWFPLLLAIKPWAWMKPKTSPDQEEPPAYVSTFEEKSSSLSLPASGLGLQWE